MASRGRKSAAEHAVVIQGGFAQRHDAPADLTEAQAAIWRETVASEPHDFFGTGATRSMLKDYCRHRGEADRVAATINSFETAWLKSAEGLKRYHEYSKDLELHTRAAANLARQLRLTNQSRYRPHVADRAGRDATKGKYPWEFDGDED